MEVYHHNRNKTRLVVCCKFWVDASEPPIHALFVATKTSAGDVRNAGPLSPEQG